MAQSLAVKPRLSFTARRSVADAVCATARKQAWQQAKQPATAAAWMGSMPALFAVIAKDSSGVIVECSSRLSKPCCLWNAAACAAVLPCLSCGTFENYSMILFLLTVYSKGPV